jgi:hypothetical protein
MNSSSSAYIPTSAAFDQVAFDNLVRRELRVANPRDAAEVAKALQERYRESPRAIGIAREAQGLPFLQVADPAPTQGYGKMASDSEWKQAVDDVEADLKELTGNSLLKDVAPELSGWRTALREALNEGNNAARFALDPRQRDKAFGVRRQLGDYARLARFVGALSPGVNAEYRQLARSLDEAAAVLLVRMGEALASAGVSDGRFLLQVPFNELQVRRDAALSALRNLVGSTQSAHDPNSWPRGLAAYQQVFNGLNTNGHGDVRILFMEGELTRLMDFLIERTSSGSADGLRAVGSTAQVDLARFRRVIAIAYRVVSPKSPPLHSYLWALQLFVDAFASSAGARLLRIARPSVLQYGLYGGGALKDAERRLTQLVLLRSEFAEKLDCLLDCGCEHQTVRAQIALDRVLYTIDRSIDLYAQGTTEFGAPEQRASAYYYLAKATQLLIVKWGMPSSFLGETASLLDKLAKQLRSGASDAEFRQTSVVEQREQELCVDGCLEEGWEALVTAMATGCRDVNAHFADLSSMTQQAREMNNRKLLPPVELVADAEIELEKCACVLPVLPADIDDATDALGTGEDTQYSDET